MYNVNRNLMILEIPKNGSRSIVQAACDFQGKKWMKCHGHMTLKHFLTEGAKKMVEPSRQPAPPLTVVAIFRNPVERLLSQIRQHERKKSNMSLNEMMDVCFKQSDILYKPQHAFIELPQQGIWSDKDNIDLRAWPMERIEEAFHFLTGGKPQTYHKNRDRNPSKFELDQIIDHKLYDDIMEQHFKPDFHLWRKACNSSEDGRGHALL